MNKLPLPIYLLMIAVLICLLIGFTAGNIRLWYGLALIGTLLSLAAIAKYWTRNDPPSDEDEDTIERG